MIYLLTYFVLDYCHADTIYFVLFWALLLWTEITGLIRQ